MDENKDIKLKNFVREKMRDSLLKAGRKLVAEGGSEALSARKLAKIANSSVGMLYNIFGTMDNYIAEQNKITWQELYEQLGKVSMGDNSFNNLNRYADVFTAYVIANNNVWGLVYDKYMSAGAGGISIAELRIIKRIELLICWQVVGLIGNLSVKEKRMMIKVLEMSLFALSSYLADNKMRDNTVLNRRNLCKLLMNTYMAGLYGLK